MQFCSINNPKFDRSGSKQTLLNLDTVTIKQFLKASGLNGAGWLKKCPYPGCVGELRVTLANEETEEYAAWCPECGWTPSDGFEPESPYLSIQEAAQALGLADTTVETLVKGGWIGALSFAKHEYSDWRIPRRLVNAIIASDGDWTIHMGVASI